MQYLFWLRFYVVELWPFCGQHCRQSPLFAGISPCQESTLRVSLRERIDLISTTCKMVVPAEVFRLADSQSSNPGSIPGSATITASITYLLTQPVCLLWPFLWPPMHRFGQLLIPALDRFPNLGHVRVVVDARGMD